MVTRKVGQKISQVIENKSEFNNILLIEGARQVGKTTLVRQVLEGHPYKEVNLEEKKALSEKIDHCEDFDQFTEMIQIETGFRVGGGEILFIDEAQESRRLGAFIRFMKEKWKGTQVILSGSSMSRIFRDDIRYPVGRVTSIHVQPFSFEEFLLAGEEDLLLKSLRSFTVHHQISQELHQRFLECLESFMEVGGLPEVAVTYFRKGDWRSLREEILLGYYNDFKRVFGEVLQSYFIAALKTTAHLLGAPFKNSHVSILMDGGKNQDIIKTLTQLEAWKMIFRVDQRGNSPESHFHPKRYLFDIGIAKQLREAVIPKIRLSHRPLNISEITTRTSLGGLIESATLQSLLSTEREIVGWKKSSSGSEVDFILSRGDQIIPVECKTALSIKNSHLGGIRDFMNLKKISLGVVVSLAPFEIRNFLTGQQIVILPLYLVERIQEILRELE